jgi:hypothetical protein
MWRAFGEDRMVPRLKDRANTRMGQPLYDLGHSRLI